MGVGGIFPPLFFVYLRLSPILLGQEQITAIYWENGEFHSDPVCTDPVQNIPKFSNEIENFKRATHRGPIFCLEFWRSRLKFSSELQRRKKRTQPPPKENLLENFSGLKEKLFGPVVDTKPLIKPRKPYPPPKSFLCGPHFFCKEKFCTGAGRCTDLLRSAFLSWSCGARIRSKIPESTTSESTKDDSSEVWTPHSNRTEPNGIRSILKKGRTIKQTREILEQKQQGHPNKQRKSEDSNYLSTLQQKECGNRGWTESSTCHGLRMAEAYPKAKYISWLRHVIHNDVNSFNKR